MKKLAQQELDVLPIGTKLWVEFQEEDEMGRKTEAIIELRDENRVIRYLDRNGFDWVDSFIVFFGETWADVYLMEDDKMEDLRSILKTGMLVETKNGDGIVMLDTPQGDLIIGKKIWMSLNDEIEGNEILKVYDMKYKHYPIHAKWDDYKNHDPIWKHKEPKKLTMKEVEELLGYKIEIVEEN